MSDPTLFEREVEEEVRRDRLEQIWRSFGPWVIGGIVGAMALSAAVIFYRDYQAGQQAQAAAAYRNALEAAESGPREEALADLRDLDGAPGAYGALARMREAALLAESAEIDGAVRAYEAVAADGGVDRLLRDLAALKASYLLADREDPEAFARRIAAQRRDNNAWAPFLTELAALNDLRRGDTEAARAAFESLGTDETVPAGLRARAGQLADYLAPADRAAPDDAVPDDAVPDDAVNEETGDATGNDEAGDDEGDGDDG